MKSIITWLVVMTTLSCGHRTPFKMDRAEPSSSTTVQQPCTNLNTATAEELAALAGIGEVIAKRVLDYRERHGRFRRPEEIIIIEGFSERKYRAISSSICVE
jgi:competence protein ComEA